MAFGGRFDVTGLISADQYGQCSSPYYITKSHIWQLTKGLQEILVLQKICNISELNVNKWNKLNTTLKYNFVYWKNIDRMSIEICKVNKLQLYNTPE